MAKEILLCILFLSFTIVIVRKAYLMGYWNGQENGFEIMNDYLDSEEHRNDILDFIRKNPLKGNK